MWHVNSCNSLIGYSIIYKSFAAGISRPRKHARLRFYLFQIISIYFDGGKEVYTAIIRI